MAKLDLKKHYRELYNPSAEECSIVVVPEMRFMMIDGAGDPNTAPAYAEAIEALYAMSYGLTFLSKTTENVDYAVMSLEGLWWVRVMAEFLEGDKSSWEWPAMIMQPDHVATATDEVRRKYVPPALDRIQYEPYPEELAVQIMYVEPYADELQPSARCTNSPPTATTSSAASTTRSTTAIRGARHPRAPNGNKAAGWGTSRLVARHQEAAVLLCGPASVDDEHVTRDHGSRCRR
jgi:hypothetical protein